METKKISIIDGENAILGRLASIVAKRLLNGENLIVINTEKIVITGPKRWILNEYKQRLHRRTLTAPWKGPFQPRRPDRLFKRTVRGMLPWKTPHGRLAYKRLRAYIGVPEEYANEPAERIEKVLNKKPLARVLTLSTLCKSLGWQQ